MKFTKFLAVLVMGVVGVGIAPTQGTAGHAAVPNDKNRPVVTVNGACVSEPLSLLGTPSTMYVLDITGMGLVRRCTVWRDGDQYSGYTVSGDHAVYVNTSADTDEKHIERITAHEVAHQLDYAATVTERRNMYNAAKIPSNGIDTDWGDYTKGWENNRAERFAETFTRCFYGSGAVLQIDISEYDCDILMIRSRRVANRLKEENFTKISSRIAWYHMSNLTMKDDSGYVA